MLTQGSVAVLALGSAALGLVLLIMYRKTEVGLGFLGAAALLGVIAFSMPPEQ